MAPSYYVTSINNMYINPINIIYTEYNLTVGHRLFSDQYTTLAIQNGHLYSSTF